jgi:hypothetical protein
MLIFIYPHSHGIIVLGEKERTNTAKEEKVGWQKNE